MAERGRPTDYKPEYAEQAAKLCALGATDFELADFFEVNTATIYRWRNVHNDFCEAVTCGKEKADERVARALYNRAVGYTFESEKIQVMRDGSIVRAPMLEHVAPDPAAAMNWLKNRQPDKWRDKQEIDHKSSDGSMTPSRVELVALGPHADSTDRSST